MKKNSNTKSTLMAIAFFTLMTAVSIHAAQSQEDSVTTSPLVTTTGPNILGAGHLMWSGELNGYYYTESTNIFNDRSIFGSMGTQTGLRYGIGSHAELTLGLSAAHVMGSMFSKSIPNNNLTLVPSVGARLQLYEGNGRIPMVTFFTDFTVPIRKGQLDTIFDETLAEPIIGLQLRSHLWKRIYLDASVGYAFNRHAPYATSLDDPLRYSLYLRWLMDKRNMVSIGWENHLGHLEYLRQLRDNFQLKAEVNVSAGLAARNRGIANVYGLVGFNWMLH